MAPLTLESLPTEILEIIAGHCFAVQALDLRQTCRQINTKTLAAYARTCCSVLSATAQSADMAAVLGRVQHPIFGPAIRTVEFRPAHEQDPASLLPNVQAILSPLRNTCKKVVVVNRDEDADASTEPTPAVLRAWTTMLLPMLEKIAYPLEALDVSFYVKEERRELKDADPRRPIEKRDSIELPTIKALHLRCREEFASTPGMYWEAYVAPFIHHFPSLTCLTLDFVSSRWNPRNCTRQSIDFAFNMPNLESLELINAVMNMSTMIAILDQVRGTLGEILLHDLLLYHQREYITILEYIRDMPHVRRLTISGRGLLWLDPRRGYMLDVPDLVVLKHREDYESLLRILEEEVVGTESEEEEVGSGSEDDGN